MKIKANLREVILVNEQGRNVKGIRARCRACGHEVSAFGTGLASECRSLWLLSESCPRGAGRNFYEVYDLLSDPIFIDLSRPFLRAFSGARKDVEGDGDSDTSPASEPQASCLEASDSASRFAQYLQLAEMGDAHAQFELGVLYDEGEGVPQDVKKAVMWFRKSAEQGFALAQIYLAVEYQRGRELERDYDAAIAWYRKAAEQGNAEASYCLGEMYYYGDGVPENLKEAAMWIRKSADQGYVHSQYLLGSMYYFGEGVSRNLTKATMWIQRAAKQSDTYAARELAKELLR